MPADPPKSKFWRLAGAGAAIEFRVPRVSPDTGQYNVGKSSNNARHLTCFTQSGESGSRLRLWRLLWNRRTNLGREHHRGDKSNYTHHC